jgi:hypothetical protein
MCGLTACGSSTAGKQGATQPTAATTRPHWHASYIEGQWGVFEGMAFEEFSDQVHVVEPFEIRRQYGQD